MDLKNAFSMSWNGPRVHVTRLDEGFKKIPLPKRRRGKAKKKLFQRKKERGRKRTSANKCTFDGGEDVGFTGFHESLPKTETHDKGFSDVQYLESFMRFVSLQSLIEEEFLEASPHPVTCMSISLEDTLPDAHILKVIPWIKLPLRCISMFDGICSGHHILKDKLNIEVEAYFACEIDPNALAVQRHNYYGSIINLGCVKQLTDEVLDSLGRIDVLLGSSPCNQLSRVNPNRKGIHDPTSSGHLFFNYKHTRDFMIRKAARMGTKFYWFYEQTLHLDASTKTTITENLGCNPVELCPSKQFLPVKRKRLYYGNIPGMSNEILEPKVCSPPPVQAFLKPYRQAKVMVLPTLTTNSSSQRSGKYHGLPIEENGEERPLDTLERELFCGFPPHFTDTGNLSSTQRMKLLGRSWSIPMVEHILKPLKDMYQQRA